eukprot:3129336-Heterocapsa_arctica.AAC.1
MGRSDGHGRAGTHAGLRTKPSNAPPLGSNGDGRRRSTIASQGRKARSGASSNQEGDCRHLGAGRGNL